MSSLISYPHPQFLSLISTTLEVNIHSFPFFLIKYHKQQPQQQPLSRSWPSPPLRPLLHLLYLSSTNILNIHTSSISHITLVSQPSYLMYRSNLLFSALHLLLPSMYSFFTFLTSTLFPVSNSLLLSASVLFSLSFFYCLRKRDLVRLCVLINSFSTFFFFYLHSISFSFSIFFYDFSC